MAFGQNTLYGTATVSVVGAGTAAAEVAGMLDATPRSLLVIAISVLLSIVGAMVTALIYFLKKEYATINLTLNDLKQGQSKQTSALAALALSHEQHIGRVNAELAERVTHEKVNRLERALTYMRAKMGLGELPELEEAEKS